MPNLSLEIHYLDEHISRTTNKPWLKHLCALKARRLNGKYLTVKMRATQQAILSEISRNQIIWGNGKPVKLRKRPTARAVSNA